jgi:hypothetical protein
MIREYESYHGVVLSRLLHAVGEDVTLRALTKYGNVAYLVNRTTVLYIKYSSKRLSPWNFSFNNEHRMDILSLHKHFGKVVLALVCGDDGVVAIDFEEFQHLLGIPSEKGAWISCSRRRREMYAVKGLAGELDSKIGDGYLIEKLRSSADNKQIC